MAKGSVGTQTNTVIHLQKLSKIECDCARCKHSKKGAGTLYCTYYDIISPNKKTCSRYWCVKPEPKSKKKVVKEQVKVTKKEMRKEVQQTMTKEEFVKGSKEWQALNRIWKCCTVEQRNEMRNDFEVVSKFIKQKVGSNFHSESDDEFRYLSPLSEEAKQFVISLVEKGEPNLYHSVMAVLNNKRGATKEEIEKFYFEKYETKRPYLIEKRKLVDEVMELCWKKFH